MKKKCFLVIVFISVSFFGMAQSATLTGHNLSLGATLGLLAGRSEEIVYRDSVSESKLSQLLWDLKPLVYAGLDLRYDYQPQMRKTGIFTNISFKVGFPAKTGVMEDRDWRGVDLTDWLTDYSVHDNNTKRAILLDFKSGPSFTIFEKFFLKPYLSYSLMYFSWEGTGGSVLHMPDLSGHYYLPSSITVITYKQTWNIVSPGISFYGEFNRYFDIEIFFNISPLVWCTAVDEHYYNNTADNVVYTDTMFGSLYFEPGLLFSLKPNTSFTLSLSFAYRNISGTRGNDTATQHGASATFANQGGVGYSVFDIGLIARLILF